MLVAEEEDLSVNVKWILFCSPAAVINVDAAQSHKLYRRIHEPGPYNLFFQGGGGGGGGSIHGCRRLTAKNKALASLPIDTQCFGDAHHSTWAIYKQLRPN